MLSSKEIRQKWLDFFEKKNHLVVPTKSLIPINDKSLLWINSGVATLKDYFSGKKKPPKNRLTNSQKSIRTNDIENVGVTARHHTMFEMLGNFSIGDYFKKEAIQFADEFLLNELKLEKEKLYITYFKEDEEAKKYWLERGYSEDHLIAGTHDTNFWDVGSGPCGPCTEIFYDRGEKYDSRGIELLKDDIENDRFIEIWNIVFSQFNNDGKNNYTELAQKNIDTGAGLERIVSILQDAPTNFDTDLFLPIIKEIEKKSSFKYEINNYFIKDEKQTKINTHFKIIADHIRAIVNAINDGATPSNISRGYIIRRLLRRAYRSGKQLGIDQKTFLHELVEIVRDSLIYEIDVKKVSEIIEKEELLFSKTIEQGQKLLEKEIQKNGQNFDFAIAFKLFETYGFPIELTQEILEEKGIKLDLDKYQIFKEKHAEASRSAKKEGMQKAINSLVKINSLISEFIGYENHESKSKILFLANSENEVEISNEEELSYVIFDKTPLYATGGGQKHDQGWIVQNGNEIPILSVFKDKNKNNVHVFEGILNKNQPVILKVDSDNRQNLERNHSSTHLLFKSLREQFGLHIKQLGSDNNEDRLTFDFPADSKPTEGEIEEIENRVNSYIKSATNRKYLITDIKTAEEMNAIMTLEEKEYMDPENVRLVEFKNITTDLCGGTHIHNSSLIEDFKIIQVENKGTGIFRIRAITTHKLINEYLNNLIANQIHDLDLLIAKNKKLDPNYQMNIDENNDLRFYSKNLAKAMEKAREDYKIILKNQSKVEFNFDQKQIKEINNKKIYINLELNANVIKNLSGELREKYPNITFVLGSKNNDKLLLVVASKEENSKEILNNIFKETNGRGGGNAIMSQGSCENKNNIINIIEKAFY